MSLSKPWKIALGIATLFYSLAPILLVLLFFVILVLLAMRGGDPGPVMTIFLFTVFTPLVFILVGLRITLLVFYTYHLIKIQEGNDLLRIILALGNYLIPIISMPVYFFIFIWPERIPEWACQRASALPDGKEFLSESGVEFEPSEA
jgi:hypothetical protein